MASALPREGLTLEFLYSHVQRTILNPLVTGSLLLGLLYFPRELHSVLPAQGQQYLPHLTSKASFTTLKVLLGLGLVRKANNYFSQLMLNNFNRDSWNHGKEVVIVTGAGGGIGEAVARAVAKSSAAVIALDLKAPEKPFSPNTHFYKVDITNTGDISALAEEIRKDHGEPTVLVNNAGVSVCRPIFKETEEQLRNIFNVNTISHFLLAKEFVPAMAMANHGHVVTVASMGSYSVYAGNVSYTCSKASALAFHEGLGQELKHRYNAPKVRTTLVPSMLPSIARQELTRRSVVHPAYVRTPMLKENMQSEQWKRQGNFVIEPETVADAIVKQLHSGMGAQLVLPERYWLATGVRGWPSWMQEAVRNSMKDELSFLGTKGKAKEGASS